MPYSKEKIIQIGEYFQKHGEEKTLTDFNLKSETLNRLLRKYKNIDDKFEINNTLKKIAERYSETDLKAIANGGRLVPGQTKVPIIKFDGDIFKIGYFTDSHIGSIYFKEHYFNQMLEVFKKEKIDMVVHSGDVTHGMNHHQDLIYELTHIGYDAQKEYGGKILSQLEWPFKCINGNHDRWFIKGNGANIVKDICSDLKHIYKKDAEWLGHDEGDISLGGKAVLKLWHGEDGNSYAVSYRLQKIVEAFTGGEKPHILLTGHTHKQGYFMTRFIHVVSGGAMSIQSHWMRSKKIENHTGFWVIEIHVNKNGVSRFKPEWFPFYA
jgi:predicted phosphodiesterase